MRFLVFFSLCLFSTFSITRVYAQKRMSAKEYIAQYQNDAIIDMKETGVPASITMGQALLESENGNSPLAIYANNHFGIKCHKEWNGPSYKHDDDLKQECFRKYKTALESYEDHSRFLMTRKHYAFLFDLPKSDYKAWAFGLKKAGYATNPRYAYMLIKIIEDNKLYELDNKSAEVTRDTEIAKEELVNENVVTQKPESVKPVKVEKPVAKKQMKAEVVRETQPRVVQINKLSCVIARTGDTYFAIANEFDIPIQKLFKYNELRGASSLHAGQHVFLEKKRKKAEEKEKHIVQPNQTIWEIGQLYGVRYTKLMKMNDIENEKALKTGSELKLQ